MKTNFLHIWQAEKYHENSGVQKEAAMHLLGLLQLKGTETILDVGCGDGKITAEIAKRLKKGSICGSDISEEMIDFAIKKFPSFNRNLRFVVQDAEKIDFSESFDLIFSSFALQWVSKIELFFKAAYKHLDQSGKLACTIPLGISDELERVLAFLINQTQWNSYFQEFELNYFLRSETIYNKLILEHNFKSTHFEVVNQKWVFPSRKDFEIYTLMWLPHLKVIPGSLQDVFFNHLMDKYIELTPNLPGGKVRFDFPRVDFIASKA